MVLEIKESCLNLVCASDLSESPPIAVIVNVQIPSNECTGEFTEVKN